MMQGKFLRIPSNYRLYQASIFRTFSANRRAQGEFDTGLSGKAVGRQATLTHGLRLTITVSNFREKANALTGASLLRPHLPAAFAMTSGDDILLVFYTEIIDSVQKLYKGFYTSVCFWCSLENPTLNAPPFTA